jgi:glutamate-1-semialdehyde aminotransferase
VITPLARLLRIASIVICLIVVASFAIFAVDQARGASSHQQQEVSNGVATTAGSPTTGAAGTSSTHESSLHKAIDEASNKLTSPFKSLTSSSSSEWVVHGVDLLLTLVIYGFGLGFLARAIRVRV